MCSLYRVEAHEKKQILTFVVAATTEEEAYRLVWQEYRLALADVVSMSAELSVGAVHHIGTKDKL